MAKSSTQTFYGTKNIRRNSKGNGDSDFSDIVNWKKLPKTRQKEFLSALKAKSMIKGVKQEDVVESQWYNVLNYCFAEPNEEYATHIAKLLDTDGLMFVRDITVALSLITEFKDDIDMDKRSKQERVLAQVIYYLKNIQKHINQGNKLKVSMPNVVLAADANQVFVVNARVLYPYLDLDIDWRRNPRAAYDTGEPIELFDKLDDDKNINPYVYDIRSRDFDLNDVLGLVADLASAENDSQLKKIPVNQANIRGVYDEFLRLVTQDKTRVSTNQELVSMFIDALTDHDNFILKNNQVTVLNTKNNTFKEYRVNGRNWYAFFSRFDTNYSAKEVKNITAVGDILLEETNRRFSGEYWTPTIWANKANDMLADILGSNWKDSYYVWDNAAGTKNLTRDFRYKHLFSSTLFQNELDIGRNYNMDNVAFQYDFLNDDPELSPNNIDNSKLAQQAPDLAKAIKTDKPIVFFTNPPYGTSGNTVGKKSKANIAKTAINEQMHQNNMGHSAENLYCQFFYRAVQIKKKFNLSNVVIAYFSNSQYLTSSNYFDPLRKEIFSNFNYKKGFLINAGEFSDTSSNWGISFTILKSKATNTKVIPSSYNLDVFESNIRGIQSLGTHTIFDFPESEGLASWVKKVDIKKFKNIKDTVPLVTGAFTTSKAKPNIFYPENAIGYAWFKGNNVEYADRETGLFSTDFSRQRGIPLTPDNFERAIVNFAVRRATKHSWINNKDAYHRPTNEFLNNKNIVADMVVYSTFNSKNLASSIKRIDYRGKDISFCNELFWLSRDKVGEMAAKNSYSDMEFEIEADQERFVYKWLQKNHKYLSNEALQVLDIAEKIVDDTFNQRIRLNDDYPEYSFMSWDAGWEQIMKITQKGRNTKFADDFQQAYKALDIKVNGYIYHYGFLK